MFRIWMHDRLRFWRMLTIKCEILLQKDEHAVLTCICGNDQCDPPDRSAIMVKERTPMELFIRHIFYDILAKNSVDKVVKLVRKLHWEDPEVSNESVSNLLSCF